VRSRNPRIHGGKPSSQLGRLAENAPATAFPRGEVESSRRARRAVRNEGEAHPMSPEKPTTVEPSLFKIGEGCQGWTLAIPVKNGRGRNDHRSSHRHGGVGGHGMRVQVVDVRDEICGGGLRGPTAGAIPASRGRTVRSSQKSERFIVAKKRPTTVERRDRTWSKRTAKQRTRRWFRNRK
jgi:hypothetical protein